MVVDVFFLQVYESPPVETLARAIQGLLDNGRRTYKQSFKRMSVGANKLITVEIRSLSAKEQVKICT
jgi:hypothetical protein